MSTTAVLLLAILGLGFLITFQIAKASEYVSILKGEKKSFEQSNRINAFLLVAFLVLGLIGAFPNEDGCRAGSSTLSSFLNADT